MGCGDVSTECLGNAVEWVWRELNNNAEQQRPMKLINEAAASGFLVDLNATTPEPPGIAPQPPEPQGIGTTFHSKSVIFVS